MDHPDPPRPRRPADGRSSSAAEARIIRTHHIGEGRDAAEWPPAVSPRTGSCAASIRAMVDFALTDENRLVRDAVRAFAEAEISPHIRRWDEDGGFPRELFGKMAEQGFLGAPIPERVRRRRHGLHQLRDPVRGAGASGHRVPRRPERPRRAQLARPPPVGDRGAAPALARAAGARREARDVRPDRARRRDRRRQPGDHGAPRRRRLPAQRPEDLDQPRRHRRPLPRLRLGRPVEEAQGRHRVPARARDARA